MDIPCAPRGGVVHQRNASSAARRYRANSRGRIVLDGQRPSCVVVELKSGGVGQRGCVRQPECVAPSANQLLVEVRRRRQCGCTARSGDGLQALADAVHRDVFIGIPQHHRVWARRDSYARAAICHTNCRSLPCARRYRAQCRHITAAIKVD